MASFRYIGDDGRLFPHASLTVEPGDVVERDENPDPRYFEPADVKPASEPLTTSITEPED